MSAGAAGQHEHFVLDGVFSRNSYRLVTRRLYGKPRPATLYLDLRDVTWAFAAGVVPLIALRRHLEAHGTKVEIEYPFDDGYWRTAGWVELLEGGEALSVDATRSFIPVQSYSSSNQLNSIINDVLEVLSRHMNCSSGVLDSIDWTLNELADNVLVHAGEREGEAEGFMQIVSHRNQGKIDLVVSDYGRGIRQSLSESRSPSSDEEAIRLAIEKGVTRDPSFGQGNGLAGSVNIVTEAGGELTIMSGNADLRLSDGDVSVGQCGAVPGTSVSLVLPTDVEIDIGSALWGFAPPPVFENSHLSDDDRIEFVVAKEASGFGNRDTGRQLRQKLQNMMNNLQGSRARIDFADVGLVSASFADEFIAKLIVEIGHFSFFSRVEIINANPFIAQTLDNVISQRSSASHPADDSQTGGTE